MFRVAVFGVAGTCLAAVTLIAAQKPSPRPRTEFVELDAAVVDDNGQSVRGLHQEDFQIKEDGRPVVVTSFTEVSAAGLRDRADGRSVVLVLDDTGVGPQATQVVRAIARLFVSRMRSADDVAVIRLTHRDDEVVGGLREALERIDEYRGGAVPFFGRETLENWLKTLANLAHQLEPIEHRRKLVVCIGARSLCDIFLPVPEGSLLWPYWVDALRATARANMSVYAVDPSGVYGQFDLGEGLVENTGGEAFVKSNDFKRDVDLVWDQAGHYYLLGYAPTARTRELHSIDVKVRRSGVQVRARRSRGD